MIIIEIIRIQILICRENLLLVSDNKNETSEKVTMMTGECMHVWNHGGTALPAVSHRL